MVGQTDDNSFPFPLTQEELSEATGMTPIHANRMLQQLRTDGLIDLRHKTLTVLDFERLKQVAAYEPRYLHLVRTERADPAVRKRVGDLVPPTARGMLNEAWELVTHPLSKAKH
jgi:DNA-binding transcriptional regulator LsrR (DeoR family)